MSVIQLILAFIFEYIFGFALSFQGFFAWLVGLFVFLLLPFIPKATGEFKRLARFHLYLATGLLGRAAVLVSEHNDILLKQMQFDDLGVETIQVGDEVKEFEDPDSALHYWMGIPFALADEVHGILFDPRHAAVGKRKKQDKDRDEAMVYATESEWEEHGFGKWYKGVFEFPKHVYEIVNLSNARRLVDGGERSEYPKRVEKMYENSRAPFKSGTSATRFILILVALIGPFGFIWFMSSQFGTGGTPTDSISFGLLYVLLSGAGLQELDIDWKKAGLAFALTLIPLAIFALLFVFVNPIIALFAAITVVLGFLFIPMIAQFAKLSTKASGGLASFLLKTGFQGYDRPVFNWTPEKYELIEGETLEHDNEPTWYSLAGTVVGFTFEPSPDSWGAEVVDTEKLEQRKEVAADGGTQQTNIPAGYVKAPSITRADGYYGAFIPKRFDDDSYYLDSGIVRARFTDSANGEKALNRLLWAKEEYGEDDGLSDKAMVYAMAGLGSVSFILGIVVFFLL